MAVPVVQMNVATYARLVDAAGAQRTDDLGGVQDGAVWPLFRAGDGSGPFVVFVEVDDELADGAMVLV